jgi:hypothetical protein
MQHPHCASICTHFVQRTLLTSQAFKLIPLFWLCAAACVQQLGALKSMMKETALVQFCVIFSLLIAFLIPFTPSESILMTLVFGVSFAGEWSCWTDWSGCSVTCGQGVRRRTRHCLTVSNHGIAGSGCEGPATGEEPCEVISCECK